MSTTGGLNKKMKKYPRILDYLQAHHPDVYAVIDDLAMHGSLNPRRGGSITFLLPDKALIAKITKAIESSDPEKATDLVGALILTDLFATPEDFAKKKSNVPNLLGNTLVIKSVSANKVLVDDGELTLDTAFSPFSRQGQSKRGNMAVWHLKGEVKLDTPPATFVRNGKKKNGDDVEGGNCSIYDDGSNAEEWLKATVKRIIAEKLECVRLGETARDGKMQCPMLSAVCSILHAFENGPQWKGEYNKARSLLTHHPVLDFFQLFCNPLVFAPETIKLAYVPHMHTGSHADYLRKYCDEDKNVKDSPALVLSKKGLERLNEERERIISGLNASKLTHEAVIKVYIELDKNNRFGSLSNVYPAELHDIYRTHTRLHLLIDEAVWFLYERLRDVPKSDGNAMAKAYCELFEDFCQLYPQGLRPTGHNTHLDNQAFYGASLDKEHFYKCVVAFLKKFALRMPCSSSHALNDVGVVVGSGEDEDIYSMDVVDVHSDIMSQLDKYDNDPMALSPGTLAELAAYKAKHGKLPDLS